MIDRITFASAVNDAKALKRLRQTTIYLDGDDPDLPWSDVQKCEPGGLHRGGIAISCWLEAKHSTGLLFKWSIEIEPRSADGRGYSDIDAAYCREVAAKLPPDARREFVEHLRKCSEHVAAKAAEFRGVMERQEQLAAELRRIAEGSIA